MTHPQMASVTELVGKLSHALHRQQLELEEEQGLLNALMATRNLTTSWGGSEGTVEVVGEQDVLPLDEQGWNLLVSYTFERRYGWSESADGSDDRAMDSLDNRSKKKINETLEQVPARFSCFCSLREALCRGAVLSSLCSGPLTVGPVPNVERFLAAC